VKILPALASTLLLCACASGGWEYVLPPGASQARMQETRQMCSDEAGMGRLAEERERLEQQCMIERGYIVRKTDGVQP